MAENFLFFISTFTSMYGYTFCLLVCLNFKRLWKIMSSNFRKFYPTDQRRPLHLFKIPLWISTIPQLPPLPHLLRTSPMLRQKYSPPSSNIYTRQDTRIWKLPVLRKPMAQRKHNYSNPYFMIGPASEEEKHLHITISEDWPQITGSNEPESTLKLCLLTQSYKIMHL